MAPSGRWPWSFKVTGWPTVRVWTSKSSRRATQMCRRTLWEEAGHGRPSWQHTWQTTKQHQQQVAIMAWHQLTQLIKQQSSNELTINHQPPKTMNQQLASNWPAIITIQPSIRQQPSISQHVILLKHLAPFNHHLGITSSSIIYVTSIWLIWLELYPCWNIIQSGNHEPSNSTDGEVTSGNDAVCYTPCVVSHAQNTYFTSCTYIIYEYMTSVYDVVWSLITRRVSFFGGVFASIWRSIWRTVKCLVCFCLCVFSYVCGCNVP